MFENFLKLFSSNKASGNIAKDRLQVLLKMDRESTSAIPEDIMEKLREELMQVINKYLEIEQDSLDVKFERNTDNEGRVSTALVANIPINKAKVKTVEYKEKPAEKPVKAEKKVKTAETAAKEPKETAEKKEPAKKTEKANDTVKKEKTAKTEKIEKTEEIEKK